MLYPEPNWVAPLWWAPPPKPPAISRPALVAAWVTRAAAPKPPKKEFADEMKGWSGVLGSTAQWVPVVYTALAAFLARVNRVVDEPEGWLAVSRLYAAYVDPLARFTAGYVAAAHQQRPRGLPNALGDNVKCYALAVAPAVRAAMAGAPGPDGTGGVVESEAAARAFVQDPERHYETYRTVAMRHYATILRAKVVVFQDNPEVCRAFAERIVTLAHFGAPPPPVISAADEQYIDGLLAALVHADPDLRADPSLSEAYLRARKTLLRWKSQGRQLHNATLLYTKLRSARLDERAAQQAIGIHEISMSTSALARYAETAWSAAELLHIEDADVLSRAAAALARYPAYLPGTQEDCWEKTVAVALLSRTIGATTSRELRDVVERTWRDERVTAGRAVSTTAESASKLVEALLFLALSRSTQTGDLGGSGTDAVDRIARRQADTDDTLHRHGYAVDDLEKG